MVLNKLGEAALREENLYLSTGTRQIDFIQPYIELVKKVKMDIKAQREGNTSMSSPFIWVVAPSGSGKTQLAYTLNANGCNCIYFVMDTSSEAQFIYQSSRDISKTLKKCIANDISTLTKNLENESDLISTIMSCSFLTDYGGIYLETIGFIHSLLSRNTENSTIEYRPMSYIEFEDNWRPQWLAGPNANDMPCVIIDEFSLADGDDQKMHLFSRNIIRALGLVCIVMGTNSHAGNLVKPVSLGKVGSVCVGVAPRPWVYVVHRLPRVSFAHTAPVLAAKYSAAVASFKNDAKWARFFQWLEGTPAPTVRPRFFRYALEALVKYFGYPEPVKSPLNALNYLLDDARERVEATKYFSHHRLPSGHVTVEWGVIGQVLNILPRSKSGNLPNDLIHCYFADLNRPDPGELYFSLFRREIAGLTFFAAQVENLEVGLEDENGDAWKGPTSVLRTADEEQLGTLILLTACPGRRSLLIQKGLSLSGAFFTKYFKNSFPSGASPEKVEPIGQIHGLNFELFVQLAVITTSAEANGRFNGTKLDEYCGALVAALKLSDAKVPPYELSENCKLKRFCELAGLNCPIIPLLASMNESYDFLKNVLDDAGLPVSKFLLTPDKDRNDGVIMPYKKGAYIGVVEAKYWNTDATNAELCAPVRTVRSDPDKYGRKHIIFFFARSASLDHEKLPEHYTGRVVFFSLCQPDADGKVFFYNDDHFDACFPEDVETIVIVITLKTFFSVYDITTGATRNQPAPVVPAQRRR